MLLLCKQNKLKEKEKKSRERKMKTTAEQRDKQPKEDKKRKTMDDAITIEFQKRDEDATLPTRSHEADAGWDLYAAVNTIIPPIHRAEPLNLIPVSHPGESRKCFVVSTKISVGIPTGYYGKIEDRSSMAIKKIKTAGGVIDSGYKGEVGVILYNFGHESITINKGDRIAQMIFHKIPLVKAVEVKEKLNFVEKPLPIFGSCSKTQLKRGEGGFGSTGK